MQARKQVHCRLEVKRAEAIQSASRTAAHRPSVPTSVGQPLWAIPPRPATTTAPRARSRSFSSAHILQLPEFATPANFPRETDGIPLCCAGGPATPLRRNALSSICVCAQREAVSSASTPRTASVAAFRRPCRPSRSRLPFAASSSDDSPARTPVLLASTRPLP